MIALIYPFYQIVKHGYLADIITNAKTTILQKVKKIDECLLNADQQRQIDYWTAENLENFSRNSLNTTKSFQEIADELQENLAYSFGLIGYSYVVAVGPSYAENNTVSYIGDVIQVEFGNKTAYILRSEIKPYCKTLFTLEKSKKEVCAMTSVGTNIVGILNWLIPKCKQITSALIFNDGNNNFKLSSANNKVVVKIYNLSQLPWYILGQNCYKNVLIVSGSSLNT